MKKLLICWLIVAGSISTLQANTFFNDTSIDTRIERYSKRAVRGKNTMTFNAYNKQTYYIYVSAAQAQDGVIINTDSALEYYIAPSEDLFYLFPNQETGGIKGKKTITIKSKVKLEDYKTATLQLKTRDYFLNIELIFTPHRHQGNKFVYFQNPSLEQNKRTYNRESFIKFESEMKDALSHREHIMGRLLQGNAKFFKINETIHISKNKALSLKHLAVVDDQYMLMVSGDTDVLDIQRKDVRLNLQPYRYSLATEIKKQVYAKQLSESLSYKNENGDPITILVFNVPKSEQKKRFFLELLMGPFHVFRKKLSLESVQGSNALFNVDIR